MANFLLIFSNKKVLALWTVNDVPGKDPPEGGYRGLRGLSPVKTPQTPLNPPRGSFQGVFSWEIIDGP